MTTWMWWVTALVAFVVGGVYAHRRIGSLRAAGVPTKSEYVGRSLQAVVVSGLVAFVMFLGLPSVFGQTKAEKDKDKPPVVNPPGDTAPVDTNKKPPVVVPPTDKPSPNTTPGGVAPVDSSKPTTPPAPTADELARAEAARLAAEAAANLEKEKKAAALAAAAEADRREKARQLAALQAERDRLQRERDAAAANTGPKPPVVTPTPVRVPVKAPAGYYVFQIRNSQGQPVSYPDGFHVDLNLRTDEKGWLGRSSTQPIEGVELVQGKGSGKNIRVVPSNDPTSAPITLTPDGRVFVNPQFARERLGSETPKLRCGQIDDWREDHSMELVPPDTTN